MSKELAQRFAQTAGQNYTFEEVIDAAANIILNALRQQNVNLADASDRLFQLEKDMQHTLRTQHYVNGVRRNTVILPSIQELMKGAN